MPEESQGTIESLSQELAKIFSPLDRLEGDGVLYLLADLGILFPDAILTNATFKDAVSATVSSATQLPELIELLADGIDTEDNDKIAQGVTGIFEVVKTLISSIDTIANNLQGAASPFGSVTQDDINQFVADLAINLIDFLIIRYLEDNFHILAGVCEVTGIIERTEHQMDSTDESKPPYIRRKIHYDRIPKLFTEPGELFHEVYNWGGNNLENNLFLNNIGRLLGGLAIPWFIQPAGFGEPNDMLRFGPFRVIPQKDRNPNQLEIHVIEEIAPEYNISVPFFLEGWIFNLGLTGELETGIGMSVVPPFDISFQPVAAQATSEINLGLIGTGKSGEPYYLLGQPSGSRIQAGEISLGSGARLLYDAIANQSAGSFFIESKIEDGKVVIDTSQGDSFLNEILSALKIESNFDIQVGIDSVQGFYFVGSSSLVISLPLHVTLGEIEIQNLVISIGFDNGKIPLQLGASFKVELGPLSAVVENTGISVNFTFPPDNTGNLGPLDVAFGFKPPTGVGLSVDAGAVQGGGYLFFDTDREEYAGALELVFSEWIALKAIGMITTQMPDGSEGFSLLIVVTAEFGNGIQLGLGFTLLGVGGILGLNRTVNIEPLKEGIRSGAAEGILFAEDVVANAPRIISDLRQFFPPQADIFLIGPLAKIGWGTPPLLNLSLAVIIEFPENTITILGVLKVILPDEDADILRIQVNFLGRIELNNNLIWFHAELFDSRVLFITLDGGMGLLVRWGDQANFIISVGGFHPRFQPPPLPFPEPGRLTASILDEPGARVTIEGYFAVTSNSVQFGARAEIFFGLSEFTVEGHLGFDVLFRFSPFYFSLDLSFGLSVKLFGMGLFSVGFTGMLEGPTPWHIEGKGSIGFWLFSVSVPFEHTWGGTRDTQLDPVQVLPMLAAEFNDLANWEALLPASSNILVSLRKLDKPAQDQLVLHPVGKLRISQRKLPLELELDKVGNQRPSDVNRLSVSIVIPDGEALAVSDYREQFAIGQFKDLDDAERLSKPAFELMKGGKEVGVAGEELRTGYAVRRVIRYESVIIDNSFKRHIKPFFKYLQDRFEQLYSFLFSHFLTGNAVSKSTLSRHFKDRLKPFDELIELKPQHWSVVFEDTLAPVDEAAGSFESYGEASDYLNRISTDNPAFAQEMGVIHNSQRIASERIGAA